MTRDAPQTAETITVNVGGAPGSVLTTAGLAMNVQNAGKPDGIPTVMNHAHFVAMNKKKGKKCGRFAIALTEDNRFILSQIAGNAPPIEVLKPIIDNPWILEKGSKLSGFFIDKYEGMSGSADYKLKLVKSSYPTVARLHVLCGKFNGEIDMWLGDFYEILNCIPIPDIRPYYWNAAIWAHTGLGRVAYGIACWLD